MPIVRMTARRWLEVLDGGLERWELAELDDPEAMADAFGGSLRFGTGGIRALMGVGPNRMNRLTVGAAAQGLARWLAQRSGETVAIGYDTRHRSRGFAEVTACVLAANGIRALLFSDPQPTPALDFAVRELGCDAGVVITASHNPREYNGFKVYGPDGVQATDATAAGIQAEIEKIDLFAVAPMPVEEALGAGLVTYVPGSVVDSYRGAVLAERLGVDCSGLHVVYSPLCGTGLAHAAGVMATLGVDYSLVASQTAPDGDFPSCPRPNPEKPDAMAAGMAQMASEGADLFLANDPDADRIGVACLDGRRARLLTGDEVGLLLLDFLCRLAPRGQGRPVAVTTIVTSPLADVICEASGVELRRTLTGFKYVGEQVGLIEAGGAEFLLGLEESCGYLRGSYVRDKDGIEALMLACELAAYHKSRGMTLADALGEFYRRYGYVLSRQLTFTFPGEAGRDAMARLMASLREKGPLAVAGLAVDRTTDYLNGAPMPVVGGEPRQALPSSDVLEWRLCGGSRVLVRPSGTEPKLKCYVFSKADSEAEAEGLLAGLCEGVSALISTDETSKGVHA